MFSINNTKTFKDSVHGYIDVPKCFVENLMDNDYFQRLRNVEQTGMRVLYPNAKHDRFSHSLGVFHLGLRAVDALLENFSKDQYWNIESDNQSVLYWAKNKVLFLIACLLHDIGHAPFSHSLETQLLNNSKPPLPKGKKVKTNETDNENHIADTLQKIIIDSEKKYMSYKYDEDVISSNLEISKAAPHEQIGALMIFNDFFKNQIIHIFESLHNNGFPRPEGKSILYAEYYQDKIILDKVDKSNKDSMTVFNDDLCFIARMIMGLKYDDWRPERQIRNCFIELLNGQNFDVDKLDYIVRDTQMSGINNISLDVDRLVKSLCIITKTKHINKFHLENKTPCHITIVHIENNNQNNTLQIDGCLHGTIIIKKGSEVTIEEGSKIESFTGISQKEVRIHYKTSGRAYFNSEATISQDSETIEKEEHDENDGKTIKQLLGKNSSKPFCTSINNATVIKKFQFVADEDVRLSIHENCNINIKGLFCSEKSIRLFNVNQLNGDISEVEILADTFKENFTEIKVPGKDGYNTFSVGFKKQAINVIANVMDARNYLYLWIYAHHKVIYYANFLIPVLAKELSPTQPTSAFPNWSLDFDNIKYLDDAYIWTIMRHQACTRKWKDNKKEKELKTLLNELFTRNYKKSIYKSLAEFDLFFEKYDQTIKKQLQEYINANLLSSGEKSKPYIALANKGNNKFSVGYFKSTNISTINKMLQDAIRISFPEKSEIPLEYQNLKITDLIYVSVDYKRKQLETLKTFIDMNDDLIPISQIPLLESQTKKTIPNSANTYFYLYYQTNSLDNPLNNESNLVKNAVRNYFEDLVENKIKIK